MSKGSKYTPEDFKQYIDNVYREIGPEFEEIVRRSFYIPGLSPNEVIAMVINPQTDAQLDFAKSFWISLNRFLQSEDKIKESNRFDVENTKIFKYMNNHFELLLDYFTEVLQTDERNVERFSVLQDLLAEKEVALSFEYDFYYGNNNYYKMLSELTIMVAFYRKKFNQLIKLRYGEYDIIEGNLLSTLVGAPEGTSGLQVIYTMILETILTKKIVIEGEKESEDAKYADAYSYFNALDNYISELTTKKDR